MSHIDDKVWLGSQKDAASISFLQSNEITLVISVEEFPEIFPWSVGRCNIKREHISMLDSDKETAKQVEFLSKVRKVIDIIENHNDGNVLVHCYAGKSRSAAIVTAYLAFKYQISIDEALIIVKKKRPCVDPRPSFLHFLSLNFSMH